MSTAETKAAGALDEFRKEVGALKQIPANKKGSLPESRREELASVIVNALKKEPLASFKRDLQHFPPLVVGRAMASVWADLDQPVRVDLIDRIKALKSERLVGELIPMSVQLLRSRATAADGTELLGMLPKSAKARQRLVAEVFGTDGTIIIGLRAPAGDTQAIASFRTLIAAAGSDDAQPYRRLQTLRLIVPWLVEHDAGSRRELKSLLDQLRDLEAKLSDSTSAEWAATLSKEPAWERLLRPEEMGDTQQAKPSPPPAIQAAATEMPDGDAPLATSPPSAQESGLSLDEARSILRALRDRCTQEARALDLILAAGTEADKYRQDLENVTAGLAEQRTVLQRQTERVSELERQSTAAEEALEGARSDRDRLDLDLKAVRAEAETLRTQQGTDAAAWATERQQLELQVAQTAAVRVSELKRRLASKVAKLLSDVPDRASKATGSEVAAVLHTRIHELLDLLQDEGIAARR